MKIQINSLAALERLLGGDTTVEIELRGAIVQEFAKKHLKAVAKSEAVTNALDKTREEIIRVAQRQLNEGVADFAQTHDGDVRNLQLNPNILVEINRKVEALARTRVDTAVREALDSTLTYNELQRMIDQRIKFYAGTTLSICIKKSLQAETT